MPAAVRVSSGENLGSMTPMDWDCGIDSSSTQGTSNSLYFRLEAHLSPNYRYRKYKNGIAYLDWTQDTPVGTVVGPINFLNGDPVRTQVECFLGPECDEENPCPDGEKCVDGECQPCDEQQATHFQIRAEFEELVTLPDGSQVMYLLSDIYPIGSGVSNQIIQLAECSGAVWYYPRIRFCDENGEPRPYTGNLALYGYCNPDGSSAMWVNSWNNIQNASWLLGQKAQMDLHFSTPLAIPRVLIEFIDASDVIWESECSGVAGDGFPPIEPVPPTEPDEPDEPEEPLPPDDIEEPLPPSGPQPPQEGLCPCEEYIGRQIGRAADILYSGLIALKRELAQGFREIVVELWEKRKMDYQLSMFFQNQQFQIMQAQHLRLYEIRQALDVIRDDIKKGLIDVDDGLIDIVKTGLQEGDKGLVDFVKDFTEQYEPVTIENEYRTQSHRVIDNLDEVILLPNKL